jgi:hypothetical protein
VRVKVEGNGYVASETEERHRTGQGRQDTRWLGCPIAPCMTSSVIRSLVQEHLDPTEHQLPHPHSVLEVSLTRFWWMASGKFLMNDTNEETCAEAAFGCPAHHSAGAALQ